MSIDFSYLTARKPSGCERGFQEFLDAWEITTSFFRISERPDDARLPLTGNLAIAGERRQHAFVAHVLAPSFEFLWTFAELFAEAG